MPLFSKYRALPTDNHEDGVRTVLKKHPGKPLRRWVFMLVIGLSLGIGAGYFFQRPPAEPASVNNAQQYGKARTKPSTLLIASRVHAELASDSAPRPLLSKHQGTATDDYAQPNQNPDDVTHYISPADPAPTMGEVIETLHDHGIHEGLGAFNPPGTSPPLTGLVVPDDFPLPDGYVRHYQVTDKGEPIQPILMFSPDFEFFDESGKLIKIPPDRVVTPELAPPGLPIVPVKIPPP